MGQALVHLRGRDPVVLAIPRGGVVVGREVATVLGALLAVVVPRKLRSPYNPELAIGAVAEDGAVFLDEELSRGVAREYVEQEIAVQRAEIARRIQVYRRGAPLPPLDGRTAIVVDDGIATGATMIAALRAVRARGPVWLVAAVPVAPPESLAALAKDADEVVCLSTPALFHAVGQFYEDFTQVDDDEVVALLQVASGSDTSDAPS